MFAPWSKVSRVEFWRRNGLRFPVGRLYEDQVVAQRMYAWARAFDVVPDVVALWRERADGSSITQRKGALTVLRDYLEGMAGGIAELEAAGHPAAVRERVHLILAMDLPPLVLRAIVFDSFLVFGLIAFRRRRQIAAWWRARRQASAALASDESLSSAP